MGCRLALVTMAGVMLAGCAGSERPLLEQFFGLSRLRDTTALQAVSTVIFEPREQGIVRTFKITSVAAARHDGEALVKEVTVAAPVVLPDGQTVDKTLVVTLRRENAGPAGSWLVTGVRDAAASPPPPRP